MKSIRVCRKCRLCNLYLVFCHFRRFMTNSTLFDELVNKALKIKSSHFAIGGNAALMAQRLYSEGSEVVLAAAVSPNLKSSLPKAVKGETPTVFKYILINLYLYLFVFLCN